LSVSREIPRLDGPAWISAALALEEGTPSVARRETALTKKLYVGNLPFSTTEAELREAFEKHGTVESVNLITDRETGRPRGFAFIEMDSSGADAARQALDGQELGGRNIRVDEAHDRRGGGGGGRGGGGGGRGGRDRGPRRY
jgi:RNA recognition motif-containing protein